MREGFRMRKRPRVIFESVKCMLQTTPYRGVKKEKKEVERCRFKAETKATI